MSRLAGHLLHLQRAIELVRVPRELGKSIEELRLEGATVPRSFGGDLPRPAEVGESMRDGFGFPTTDGGEATDNRGRGATAPDDAPHERVSVRDRQGALPVAHVVGLAGSSNGNAKRLGGSRSGFSGVAGEAFDASHLGGQPG